MKRIRLLLGIVFFCVIFGLVAFPELFLRNMVHRVCRRSLAYRRQSIAHGTVRWGDLVFRVSCWLMRITPHFRLPEMITSPAIIIANHRSAFDIAIMVTVLKRVGLTNTRWVIKAELAGAPAIGWMGRESGGVFVHRSKDPQDIARMRRGAEQAHEDRASVLLFPEGTRFTGAV
ncbi:1-acyl-sn-glycerol-3-phosphate acyltransferase, partial [Candidatus Uhrbacteria bacterium]|nr:1-acyl-sn-glycerol-3-phosphate acyltransferase [Candidatus Uhrbacteria bacterium]